MERPQDPLVLASLVYVAVFVVTIPVWWFALLAKHLIASNAFFSIVNSVFVQQYGYVWFTLAYMSHCFHFANHDNYVPVPVAARQLRRFLLNTGAWVVVNFWFFGPLVVERLNAATGGHCEENSVVVAIGMHMCKDSTRYVWVDGFDLLGHYYFIVTLSLWLLHNRTNMPLAAERENVGSVSRSALSFVQMLSAWLLTVWFLEFCITSIFFHTVGERFAGLVSIPVVFGLLALDRSLAADSEEQ